MSIRIYSKKAFAMGPGAQRGTSEIELFTTVPMAFQDLPDKYASDPTFKLAVQAGDITIVESAGDVKKVETKQDFEESNDPVAEYYEKLKVMNQDEVKAEAEKYGAEFIDSDKLKENKKRVFEAFKQSK